MPRVDDDWMDAGAYSMLALTSENISRALRTYRPWRWRGFGKPMFTIKDDDRAITWDAEAMAKRAFREAKKS